MSDIEMRGFVSFIRPVALQSMGSLILVTTGPRTIVHSILGTSSFLFVSLQYHLKFSIQAFSSII